jgi:hypothetical protein
MVRTSYAVTWRNGDGVVQSGKAELRAHALRLEGTSGEVEDVRYDELAGVSIGRTSGERIAGRQTLILERAGGLSPVRLASVAQLGIISELAERLADLHLGHLLARNRIVVVVPLREGVIDQVRELVDKGPPFELAEAGLRQHQVFLTDQEALFFFDTADDIALHRLFADPNVWAAATVWGEFAGGPARIGEEAFAWAKSGSGAS